MSGGERRLHHPAPPGLRARLAAGAAPGAAVQHPGAQGGGLPPHLRAAPTLHRCGRGWLWGAGRAGSGRRVWQVAAK